MHIGKKIVMAILITTNLIVVAMMIVTLFGSVISPQKLLFPAYFTLIFPITILLNIAFVIFWLLSRKWLFLISLSLIIFSSKLINNTLPVNFGKLNDKNKGKNISILTYNTMVNDAVKKHTAKNPNMVIKYILDNNADIVCIQEFGVGHTDKDLTHEDILRIFKKYPYKQIYYKKSQGWCKYGVATFSKYPIIRKDTVKFISETNSAIISDIVIDKDTIRLINNHLESNRLTEQDKAQPIQLKDNFDTHNLKETTIQLSRKLRIAYKTRAAQADVVADLIKKSPYKLIVLGDFNDVPSSYVYTRIKGNNLKDAFAETGFGIGWTFNQSIYRFRIDYVMYDPHFKVVDYKVDKIRYSDHYPVYCKLKL